MKLWSTRSLLIVNIFLYYVFVDIPTLALAAETKNAKIVPDDKLKKPNHADVIVPPVLDDDDDDYDFEDDLSSKNASGEFCFIYNYFVDKVIFRIKVCVC
jgi:hypothetical protein